MVSKSYMNIVEHYEQCLETHGDNHRGVDWPNEQDVDIRYQVMVEVISPQPLERVSVLDFGCGAAHFYDYILRHGLQYVDYSGLDISPKFIALCKQKYPQLRFYCMDILEEDTQLPQFDYIIMNGVFTEKRNLSFEEMLSFFKALIRRVYPLATRGIAFNVMSKQVDWEREDLFHLPLDTLADFLTKEITRNFVIRFNYGLYEYTTYIYK